jgi:hypothetical protein
MNTDPHYWLEVTIRGNTNSTQTHRIDTPSEADSHSYCQEKPKLFETRKSPWRVDIIVSSANILKQRSHVWGVWQKRKKKLCIALRDKWLEVIMFPRLVCLANIPTEALFLFFIRRNSTVWIFWPSQLLLPN